MNYKLSELIKSSLGLFFEFGYSDEAFQTWVEKAESLENRVEELEAENQQLRHICTWAVSCAKETEYAKITYGKIMLENWNQLTKGKNE